MMTWECAVTGNCGELLKWKNLETKWEWNTDATTPKYLLWSSSYSNQLTWELISDWMASSSKSSSEMERRWMTFLVSIILSFGKIYNGNWTEWSAIWSEIIHVISKSNERAARVQFEITSMISDQNCTTWSSITTLLNPFWNRTIYSLNRRTTRFWSVAIFIEVMSSL